MIKDEHRLFYKKYYGACQKKNYMVLARGPKFQFQILSHPCACEIPELLALIRKKLKQFLSPAEDFPLVAVCNSKAGNC